MEDPPYYSCAVSGVGRYCEPPEVNGYDLVTVQLRQSVKAGLGDAGPDRRVNARARYAFARGRRSCRPVLLITKRLISLQHSQNYHLKVSKIEGTGDKEAGVGSRIRRTDRKLS